MEYVPGVLKNRDFLGFECKMFHVSLLIKCPPLLAMIEANLAIPEKRISHKKIRVFLSFHFSNKYLPLALAIIPPLETSDREKSSVFARSKNSNIE